jgi:hypothetical protein
VLLKNDVTALSTSIPAGTAQGTSYTSGILVAAGDYLTVNITQAGSASTPGTDLYLQLQYSAV